MKNDHKNKCENCDNVKNSLFCHLENPDLDKIDEHKTTNVYKKGQVIFHEGNRPLGLFCMKNGKVKIYKSSEDGHEQIVRLAGPGGLLGYRSFLSEDNYSASAIALEDTSICFIDKDDFTHVLKKNETLSQELIKLLTKDLREAETLVFDMARKSVRERLAEVLILLKRKYGTDDNDDRLLNAKLSREDLANYVGTATETLIRFISELKADKIIETKGKAIWIINETALADIANLDD